MATKIRLERLLSNLGYGGRKEMAMAIKNEWLEVDGEVVKNPSLSVDVSWISEGRIVFDGEVVDPFSPMTMLVSRTLRNRFFSGLAPSPH